MHDRCRKHPGTRGVKVKRPCDTIYRYGGNRPDRAAVSSLNPDVHHYNHLFCEVECCAVNILEGPNITVRRIIKYHAVGHVADKAGRFHCPCKFATAGVYSASELTISRINRAPEGAGFGIHGSPDGYAGEPRKPAFVNVPAHIAGTIPVRRLYVLPDFGVIDAGILDKRGT